MRVAPPQEEGHGFSRGDLQAMWEQLETQVRDARVFEMEEVVSNARLVPGSCAQTG